MGLQLAITWHDQSTLLWIFCNNKDHKNDNRAVAEYKQKELDNKISQLFYPSHAMISLSTHFNAPILTSNNINSSFFYNMIGVRGSVLLIYI
jgi:hypothetical protein